MGAERVSIVVPTYREPAQELDAALARLVTHVRAIAGYQFDVLVVDDSDAPTQARLVERVKRLQSSLGPEVPMRVLPGPRRGKGAAIRLGVQQATGEILFTIDADLPVRLSYIEDFLRAMRATGAHVVVAERDRDRYADDPVRDVIARVLRFMQQTLVFHGARFEDTQCGFKAFRTHEARAIAERQVVDGGMVDLEYLYAATIRGLKIERVHVATNPQARPSRIRILRCVVLDPVDIARLKVSGLAGRYRPVAAASAVGRRERASDGARAGHD